MFDAVTYGAAVGAAKRYTDEHSGSDDAVKYTEQDLTAEQQAQVRENIGAAASDDIPTDAVKYTAQTLTNAQKLQARQNIGAAAEGGDDNKLRLGQIAELTGGNSQSVNWRKGFGKITSINISSLVFTDSAPSSPPVVNANSHFFGDFIAYNTAEGTRVFPIAGRKSGKPTTGKWIYVESCELMFFSCGAITSLDLSMFDTTGVAIMQSMFSDCTALTALDLSAFDTSSVVNMRYMFNNCTSLKTLDLSSFDMTNVVEYTQMFGPSAKSAPPLTTLKCPKINPHDDIPLNKTLYSQDGTAYTKLPVTTGTSIELRQSWT